PFLMKPMDYLVRHIEGLIFCSANPIQVSEIKACLEEMFEAELPESDIQQAIEKLQERYQQNEYSFEVIQVGNGFQFMTKPAYQESIGILLKHKSKKRLSKSALETLAIVAYKQPVTKSQLEQIRGVNCDYAVKKLLEKELLEIRGKSDAIGRPLLYGTSPKFLEYFGINDIKELPTPKDFSEEENEIGDVGD
ncbi:MAG: SMC-Scp complex subunit ScpB, partial [Flammeovirgaceae bacterium]